MNIITMAVGAVLLASCSDTIEMRRPPVYELPELPVVEDIHTYKAPLYWSIYEYCYTGNRQVSAIRIWILHPNSGTRSSTGWQGN